MSLQALFAQAYTYETATNGVSANPAATEAAMAAILLPFLFTVLLVAYTLYAWLAGHIFKKAGIPAWKAWVPFYNLWIIYRLGNIAGWWAVLFFVPIINIVAIPLCYVALYRIGIQFGKSGAFVLWAIFLPLIWAIWLAFGNSTWQEIPPDADTTQP